MTEYSTWVAGVTPENTSFTSDQIRKIAEKLGLKVVSAEEARKMRGLFCEKTSFVVMNDEGCYKSISESGGEIHWEVLPDLKIQTLVIKARLPWGDGYNSSEIEKPLLQELLGREKVEVPFPEKVGSAPIPRWVYALPCDCGYSGFASKLFFASEVEEMVREFAAPFLK